MALTDINPQLKLISRVTLVTPVLMLLIASCRGPGFLCSVQLFGY